MVEQLLFFRNQSKRPLRWESTPLQMYYDKIFTYSLQVQFSQACSGIASLEISTVCNSECSLCWEGSWRMLPSRWKQNACQGKIQAWAGKEGEIIVKEPRDSPLSRRKKKKKMLASCFLLSLPFCMVRLLTKSFRSQVSLFFLLIIQPKAPVLCSCAPAWTCYQGVTEVQ